MVELQYYMWEKAFQKNLICCSLVDGMLKMHDLAVLTPTFEVQFFVLCYISISLSLNCW